MIKLIGVSKTFNPGTIMEKKALIDVNLELREGDFVTVIGETARENQRFSTSSPASPKSTRGAFSLTAST